MSSASTATGQAMFARYAYPPNVLGYCGVGDGQDLLEFADGQTDPAGSPGQPIDFAQRARSFDGAWPYLAHLAAVSGAASALDERVVEAYWVGNQLLEAAAGESFARTVRTAFGSEHGADLAALEASRPVAHHTVSTSSRSTPGSASCVGPVPSRPCRRHRSWQDPHPGVLPSLLPTSNRGRQERADRPWRAVH